MYQEIAVAKGEHYDTLNRRMDNCQESIEALSDQIQRLQGEKMRLLMQLAMHNSLVISVQQCVSIYKKAL